MLFQVLLVILILMLLGVLPQTGFHQYGYAPAGGLGLVLIIVLVIILLRGG